MAVLESSSPRFPQYATAPRHRPRQAARPGAGEQRRRFAAGLRIPIEPKGENEPKRGRGRNKPSRHRKERGQSTYKFVDRARIRVAGGRGGSGCLSFERLGSYKKRPDGGHGGVGGCVVLVADPNQQTLSMSKHHHSGEDGGNGMSRARHGRNGRDSIVPVPCGVVVRRVLEWNEEWDEERREAIIRESNESADGGEERLGEVAFGGSMGDRDAPGFSEDLNGDEINHDKEITIKTDEPHDSDVGKETVAFNGDEESNGTGDGFEIEDQSFDEIDETVDETYRTCSEKVTFDYEAVVNTGVRADDGYYHWRSEDVPEDDEWISSTREALSVGERHKVVVADLNTPGTYVVVARGGRGGAGNCTYAKRPHSPNILEKAAPRSVGGSGEMAHLELELKLIADLGLVGFPNAGKSSLLAAMSMAKPEIAPYPFTTLHPLVGCLEYRDGRRVLAADVPGLIEGASAGRGRGHDFLRHLERTKALLYIVDAAGVDGRNPVDDLRILVDEISSYGDGDMLTRPSLIVANKLDLFRDVGEREQILFDVALAAEEAGLDYFGDVIGISAGVTGEGLTPLSKAIREVVVKAEEVRNVSE